MSSLFSVGLDGTKWTFSATALGAILQIVTTIVMARLLDPTAFGLMAMANVVTSFGSYIARLGLGSALVQAEQVSDRDVDFALTLSVLLGAVTAASIWIASPLISNIFREPRLTFVIQIVGISMVFTAVSSTLIGLLTREMKFKQIAIVETVASIGGSGLVGITAAALGLGVWSLVLATLTAGGLKTLGSVLALARRFRPRLAFSEHRRLVNFGSRFSVNSLLEYFSGNLDTIVAGRVLTSNFVGLYNRAFMVANLPMQMVVSSITRVMFPSFSRLQSDRKRLSEAELKLFALVGSLTMSICLGMIPAARNIVLVLLGDQWTGAIDVLRILLLAVPLNFMAHVLSLTMDSAAELKRKTRVQAWVLVVFVVLLVVLSGSGMTGIAWAVVVSELFRLILYALETTRIFGYAPAVIAWPMLGIVLPGVVVWGAISLVSVLGNELPPLVGLLLQMGTGAAAVVVFFWVNVPKYLGLDVNASVGATARRLARERLGGGDSS